MLAKQMQRVASRIRYASLDDPEHRKGFANYNAVGLPLLGILGQPQWDAMNQLYQLVGPDADRAGRLRRGALGLDTGDWADFSMYLDQIADMDPPNNSPLGNYLQTMMSHVEPFLRNPDGIIRAYTQRLHANDPGLRRVRRTHDGLTNDLMFFGDAVSGLHETWDRAVARSLGRRARRSVIGPPVLPEAELSQTMQLMAPGVRQALREGNQPGGRWAEWVVASQALDSYLRDAKGELEQGVR